MIPCPPLSRLCGPSLLAAVVAGATGCELLVIHTFVPCDDPAPTAWDTVAVADDAACAVDVDGGVACWGRDPGLDGRSADRVVLGAGFGCRLGADGTVGCVGSGPAAAGPSTAGGWVEVVAGDAHACAVSELGVLECWGDDAEGQVSGVPTGPVDRVAASGSATCATDADSRLPACGGGAPVADGVPADLEPLAALAGGADGMCGVDPGGAAVCWGDGADLDLEALGSPLVELAVGTGVVCGIDSGLTLRCVGSAAAADAPGISAVSVSVAPDGAGGCAVTDRMALQCWGAAGKGQP